MDWLKDKKNLPIVIALAVVLLLGSGGLIAWELGAFSGSSDATAPSGTAATGQPPTAPIGGGTPPGYPGSAPSGQPPAALPRGAVKTASAIVTPVGKPISTDPRKGNDPFYLAGGQKKLNLVAMRLPPRDFLPPMNLYSLRPPTPPTIPVSPNQAYETQVSNYRLAGIVNGSDGNINAILDLGGSTQTVKPGDSLPDGSHVTTIQATNVTLRTAGGTTISLPLSSGAPDQNPQPGQFNGPPGYNGPPPGFVPPGYNGNGPPPGFVPPTGPPPGFIPPGYPNGGG